MMRRSLSVLTLGATLVVAAASCSSDGDVPPEGFTIAVRFQSIDVAVVDTLRIRFIPPDGTGFAQQPEKTFEDGAITMRIEEDGSLVLAITGEHLRANVMPSSDGQATIYELHVWSDDPAMRAAPLLFGTVFRGTEAIGDGSVYLPSWPPPYEDDGMCVDPINPDRNATCRAQLAIECSRDAAAAGRCSP